MRVTFGRYLAGCALALSLFWAVAGAAQDDETQRLQRASDAAEAALAQSLTRARASCAALEAAKAEKERAYKDKVCGKRLRPEVEAMRAAGVSRADIRQQVFTRIAECMGTFTEPVLAAQRACIADLEAVRQDQDQFEAATQAVIEHNKQVVEFIREMAKQQDEQARLKESIASSEAESERARAEIEASRARQRAMLDKAERILQGLARQ